MVRIVVATSFGRPGIRLVAAAAADSDSSSVDGRRRRRGWESPSEFILFFCVCVCLSVNAAFTLPCVHFYILSSFHHIVKTWLKIIPLFFLCMTLQVGYLSLISSLFTNNHRLLRGLYLWYFIIVSFYNKYVKLIFL